MLDEIEGVLIAAMEPKLNKQGPSFKDAVQFEQDLDENVKDISLEDIDAKVDSLTKLLTRLTAERRNKREV